jgi:nitrogen regulatory protein P-II 1
LAIETTGDENMKKIEAIIKPFRLEAVMCAMHGAGVEGMTVTEVKGHGRQKGHVEVYKGKEYQVDLLPKTKIDVVVEDEMVDVVVAAIMKAANTDMMGDGKIFVYDVVEAICIRTGGKGGAAISSKNG